MYKFMLHGIWHKLVYSIFINLVALFTNHVLLLLLFIMLVKHKHYDYVLNTCGYKFYCLATVYIHMVTCTVV